MKTIWLIYPYGRLPHEGWRDYRTTMIARALTAAGHQVVWWISAFDHGSKAFRNSSMDGKEVFPGFTARLIPTTSYQKHISLARIRSEQHYGENLLKATRDLPPPDLLIAVDPAVFYAKSVLELQQRTGARLVVDILDLWPELFHIVLPAPLRRFGRIIFAPLYARRARIFNRADAIIAVTKDYLQVADSAPCPIKEVAYLGVDQEQVRACTESAIASEIQMRLELCKSEGEVWAIYAGTLGPNYDLDSVLDAVALLRDRCPALHLLIAGAGILKDHIQERIARESLTNVHFLGSLPVDFLTQVYSVCDIALSTYVDGSTVSMPVKAYDYMAAGLPMINSLGRELGELVEKEGLGINYPAQQVGPLAAALQTLTEDAPLRSQMRKRALAQGARFDSHLQHACFVSLIKELCP